VNSPPVNSWYTPFNASFSIYQCSVVISVYIIHIMRHYRKSTVPLYSHSLWLDSSLKSVHCCIFHFGTKCKMYFSFLFRVSEITTGHESNRKNSRVQYSLDQFSSVNAIWTYLNMACCTEMSPGSLVACSNTASRAFTLRSDAGTK